MFMTIHTARLFIGGEWSEASSGEYFEVVNPATEEVIAKVPNAGPIDMQNAIAAARSVQDNWVDKTASERATILLTAAIIMRERSDHLAKLITFEEGKPVAEAKGEVLYAASFLEGVLEHPQ